MSKTLNKIIIKLHLQVDTKKDPSAKDNSNNM